MKKIKVRNFGVVAVLMLSPLAGGASENSLSDPCEDSSRVAGEVFIVELNGTGETYGVGRGIEELTKHLPVMTPNGVTAEVEADRSIVLNVYERVIASRLGQKVGSLGSLRFAYATDPQSQQVCQMSWAMADRPTRVFTLLSQSAAGDLVFSESLDGADGKPALILTTLK